MLEAYEFDDESVKELAIAIISKPQFKMYERIDRSDKYIVCRVNVNNDFQTDQSTNFYKFVADRNTYYSGDIRVSFF